jgi:SpoVK/Ycf46/Vps4 family AAA+-type ATPase
MILSSSIERKFQQIENEYQDRDHLAHNGLRYRQTILLHGFQGCGKTLGAERLAYNTGLQFLKIKGSSMPEIYKEKDLKSRFHSHLFFIEDFDSLAMRSTEEVDSFLAFLDRYVYAVSTGLLAAEVQTDVNQGKVLLASVFNKFEAHIKAEKPGEEEIRKLLKQTLIRGEVGRINLTEILPDIYGLSCAQIIKIAEHAVRQAAMLKRPVSQIDLQDAIAEYKGEQNG